MNADVILERTNLESSRESMKPATFDVPMTSSIKQKIVK
jgi:hypothetical protein